MDVHFNFDFLGELKNPERLIKWCMDVGLIGNMYLCPNCKKEMVLSKRKQKTDNYAWRCYTGDHDVRRSLRKGSVFENSRLSMHEILMMTYMWIIKVQSNFIAADLKVSQKTVVDWKRLCRDICLNSCENENETVGGEGVIVEFGECNFGKNNNNQKEILNGRWAFGAIERGSDKCFMVVVSERSKDALFNVIKDNVRPGSMIISNCWRSYNCLKDKRFQNLIANNMYHFKEPDADAHTYSIDSTWNAIKRQVNSNSTKGQVDSYLFEYMWRRRHQDKKNLMLSFVECIRLIYVPVIQDD